MEDKKKQEKKSNGAMGKFANALKKNKKLEIIFYVGIILIILALYLSTLFQKSDETAAAAGNSSAQSNTEQEVEDRLSAVLSSIKGAGRVKVMITYESGPELITAMNVDINTNTSGSSGDGKESSTENKTESRKPATVNGNGGTTPIVLTEKQPAVRGVIVVAEGASNIAVRLDLQRAVQTVLNISVDCIEVFELAAELPEDMLERR